MKFFIEFNPCDECKNIIRELKETTQENDSKKFLRHITYNHVEIIQGIIDDLPKKMDQENFPWFR